MAMDSLACNGVMLVESAWGAVPGFVTIYCPSSGVPCLPRRRCPAQRIPSNDASRLGEDRPMDRGGRTPRRVTLDQQTPMDARQ